MIKKKIAAAEKKKMPIVEAMDGYNREDYMYEYGNTANVKQEKK